MFHIGRFFTHRNFSTISSVPNMFQHLKERSLLKVAGSEVKDFLQGLLTNDVQHLTNSLGCMYTLLLNTKGRVMYDAVIYRTTEKDSVLIECDSSLVDSLEKHLKMYRVKRNVTIEKAEGYAVYVVCNTNVDRSATSNNSNPELIVPCATVETASKSCRTYRDLLIYRDPRLEHLGLRILAPTKPDVKEQIQKILNLQEDTTDGYRQLRYKLGVGEGVNDFPPNNCFPLECNCDYLHGVSFHKGCYIGQELTARTHHTGVVRKRLMPLYFKSPPSSTPLDNTIVHEGINLGKLRGITGNVGLALLRVAKALEFSTITVGDGVAETLKPSWWPIEAPKDRMTASKG